MVTYVQVWPFCSVSHPLTYTAKKSLSVGTLVRIRVQNRRLIGLVTSVKEQAPTLNIPLLEIEGTVYDFPVVTGEQITLIQRLSRYYACSMYVAMEAAIPSFFRTGKPFPKSSFLRVTPVAPSFSARAIRLQSAYHWIQQHPFVSEDAFRQQFPKNFSVIRRLLEKQYIERVSCIPEIVSDGGKRLTLTEEQQRVFDALQESLKTRTYRTHLLMGITGSGKTEIYHALIQQAKALGWQTLYLVPEIMLSKQALEKLKARLSETSLRVGVWHSRLSNRAKMQLWEQSMAGMCDVILGTRSAVFVPMKRLGLVVVDEEHEPSYKQSENPRYHGRDLALYRAQLAQALCVLGSATPSVESWSQVKERHYSLHTLIHRPSGQSLPAISVVDMRYEKPSFEGSFVLSALLREKLCACLDRKEQALLFLNRRGYAPYVYCAKCQKRLECPNCKSHFVLHRTDRTFRCHICAKTIPAYRVCPTCHSPIQTSVGFGTQRVEACLKAWYPNMRVLRLDSDTVEQQPNWYEAILEQRYDVILGTQMIAKGLDFPKVTLVGVIQADALSMSEDFRAAERLFQLLVQVIGRAGRSHPGEVVVQTFSPTVDWLQDGCRQAVASFLDREYALRKQHHYPPFCHVIRHLFRSISETMLHYTVEQWSAFLQKQPVPCLKMMGPAVPYLNKANRFYRMHLLYFVQDPLGAIPILQRLRQSFPCPKNVMDVWDVDPIDFR